MFAVPTSTNASRAMDNTTAPFASMYDLRWELTPELRLQCWLCIIGSSLGLIGSIAAVAIYVRYAIALRHPVLDALMASFVLSIGGSLDLLVSAIVRLFGDAMKDFCNASGVFSQTFLTSGVQMEGVFFACVALFLYGQKISFKFISRCFAFALLWAGSTSLIPFFVVEKDPRTGTHYGATEPWCWYPHSDQLATDEQTTRWRVIAIVCGYMWTIISMVVGLISFIATIYRLRKVGLKIHSSVKWRMLYFFFFCVAWLTMFVYRSITNHLPESAHVNLGRFHAITPGLLPFANFIIFFVSENIWGLMKGDRCEDRDDQFMAEDWDTCDDDNIENFSTSDASLATVDATAAAAGPLRSPKLSPRQSPRALNSPLLRGGAAPGIVGAFSQIEEATRIRQEAEAEQRRVDSQRVAQLRAVYDSDLQEWLMLDEDGNHLAEGDGGLGGEVSGNGEKVAMKDSLITKVTSLPKPPIGVALSLVAGYCDACGFVNLELMTAHVTGNMVLMGVSIANKDEKEMFQKIILKATAIPVFCTVILIVYSLAPYISEHRRFLLFTQLTCLIISAMFAVLLGPFLGPDAKNALDSYGGFGAGMFMVAALAVQNSYQRFHLTGLPMTTFVTGNTNQIMHDLVDLFRKRPSRGGTVQERAPLWARTQKNVMCVGAFFIGTIAASLMTRFCGMWAFLPPGMLIAALIIIFWDETATPPPKKSQ